MHKAPTPPPHKTSLAKWLQGAVPLVVLVAVLGAVAANPSLRVLLAQATRLLDLRAVMVVLPVQLVAILVCTCAQQALKVGVSFRASFVSRLVRDAGHNLLIFPPGLGEMIGARMLVLLGARSRAAVALRVLDIAAEVIGEVPYMMLAGWVLWHGWHEGWRAGWRAGLRGASPHGGVGMVWALAIAGVAGAVWLGFRAWRQSGHHIRWRATRTGRRLYAELHLMRRELKRQRAGLPLAIGLHVIGWGLSGVQVWLAGRVFGLGLSLYGALAIESAATSARVILFFVPGGLVMQEAGAVLAGAAMGVAAPQALALSLVLRLRDVAFGAALLAWPAMEWRGRQRGAGAGAGVGAGL